MNNARCKRCGSTLDGCVGNGSPFNGEPRDAGNGFCRECSEFLKQINRDICMSYEVNDLNK